MKFQVNVISLCCFAFKSVSKDIMDVCQIKIFLYPKVEKEAESEITQGHQVVNRLKNIPTCVFKGTITNKCKLSNWNSRTKKTKSGRFSMR